MDFTQSLKTTAQHIIELTDQPNGRIHTWNQEKSAPKGGYTDRAGFMYYDDIELFADVYAPDDNSESLLRARLARERKDEAGRDRFTIITLDFDTDLGKTRAIIAHPDRLIQETLIMLLNHPSTTPKYIQVSLDSGKDAGGRTIGKRYEYEDEVLQRITDMQQEEFVTTLRKAYGQIVQKFI